MKIQPIELQLHFGDKKSEALAYLRNHPDVTMQDFLRVYPSRALRALSADILKQPLKNFLIIPISLNSGEGIELKFDSPSTAKLRGMLDDAYISDLRRSAEPGIYPEKISDIEAVQIGYRHELDAVARFLKNDLSVLIVCDKILTEHIYEYVCKQAGKTPVLDDALPEGAKPPSTGQSLDRAIQGNRGSIQDNLPLLIKTLKSIQVLVLRSVDILDTPPLIEILYQGTSSGHKPQLLGFLDPSIEAKKVLTDRFAVRAGIMGLPRYIQPDSSKPPVHTVTRLITAHERECFDALDPEGLYKNVSGLNAVQFRNAMKYVGAEVSPQSPARKIYEVIRQFKSSSSNEIEIPDTTFGDIGGYDRVKRELQRIVALATGRIEGIDEEERKRLIPRGFIFHGPPGTGKTLFAKAIANEMNATIQMVSGPEIMDKYVGQSESNLRHIFATARRNAPSVIFFDEFDSVASQRSTYADGGARANNAVVAQLLTELDGFREDQAVLVIGTTNRLDIIDEALLRPSRLRPIEINLPDYAARRSVASIHSIKFGVDKVLIELCKLVLENLDSWRGNRKIPQTFLNTLTANNSALKSRYDIEGQRAGFLRDLQVLFKLVEQSQSTTDTDIATVDQSQLEKLKKRILEIANGYGIDLVSMDMANLDEDNASVQLKPIQTDLRDIFALVHGETKLGGFSPESFWEGILNLVAEYTEGFNNDEIRAIFQEASLDYHLDGQLITPRYIGLKIGIIRKRRDERQIVHLATPRSHR